MSIQRYRLEDGWREVRIIPDDNGDFLFYKDHCTELAALRADAERYRWLRDVATGDEWSHIRNRRRHRRRPR